MSNTTFLNRVTGLLIIEVQNSNPNGDPDNEGEPRQRSHDQRGIISAVSFKRKLRDLVELKEGPVWHGLSEALGIADRVENFEILESRGRDRAKIMKMTRSEFQETYWDARLFGTTFLESTKEDASKAPHGTEHFIRSGVIQFANAISVAPIVINRQTNTNKSGVEEGKDRGMAPLADRTVEHGVYCMPFFINPTAAYRSGCQQIDIELFKKLVPCAYPHNPSRARPFVDIRHAWFVDHGTSLGSVSDFALIDALMPKKKTDPHKASSSWGDYEVSDGIGDLGQGVVQCTDLMNR